MKKFYLQAVAFIISFCAITASFIAVSAKGEFSYYCACITNSIDYMYGGPYEIGEYIRTAQNCDGSTKLILGDSVCCQMFNNLQPNNPDFTIIGSNGAVTMAGQYLLLKEYVDSHPDATDVFLIVLPESLARTFDAELGYTYAVCPFAEADLLKNLDESSIEIMADTYGKIFLNKKLATLVDKSAPLRKIYLNQLVSGNKEYELSNFYELADQYVVKMDQYCAQANISFHLYSAPVSEAREEIFEYVKQQYQFAEINYINPEYFDSIYYYPQDQTSDGVHFSGDYDNQSYYNQLIKNIYDGEILLDYLIL